MKATKISLKIQLTIDTTKTVSAYQIGDYAYHKNCCAQGYVVTHINSGITIKRYPTQKQAREKTILFQQAPKWTGNGISLKQFKKWLSEHA